MEGASVSLKWLAIAWKGASIACWEAGISLKGASIAWNEMAQHQGELAWHS